MWNNIPAPERLHLWKELRTTIANFPLDEQLSNIALFFASAPYAARTLDYYDPKSWPTPWEILYSGSLCKSAISILMFHTIYMLHTGHITSLYLIDDGEDEYLVPVIDDQFILNYHLGAVNSYSTISDSIIHKLTFVESQIRLVN